MALTNPGTPPLLRAAQALAVCSTAGLSMHQISATRIGIAVILGTPYEETSSATILAALQRIYDLGKIQVYQFLSAATLSNAYLLYDARYGATASASSSSIKQMAHGTAIVSLIAIGAWTGIVGGPILSKMNTEADKKENTSLTKEDSRQLTKDWHWMSMTRTLFPLTATALSVYGVFGLV